MLLLALPRELPPCCGGGGGGGGGGGMGVGGLVCFDDPESYTGWGLDPWQVQQVGQVEG